MYLPNPIYKAAPHYWLIIGLLFAMMGFYVGLEHVMGFVYIGAACCAWAIRLFIARQQGSANPDEETATE